MKERIIVADGITESELLRTLALNGSDTIALRVMRPAEAAEYSLLLSSWNIPARAERLDSVAVILRILRDGSIPYFSASTSFRDAVAVFNSLNLLRKLVTDDDERTGMMKGLENGSFPEKNEALIGLYDRYMEDLKNLGLDDVSLMRLALDKGGRIDASAVLLDEYRLSPLERKLVETKFSVVEEKSIADFYEEKKNACREEFVRAYGAENEVEDIISTIYRNKLPLDECLVVSASPDRYSLLLHDISSLHDIPVTYSTGLPVSLSTSASLFRAMLDLERGYYGKEAWKALAENEGFNVKIFREKTGLGDLSLKTFMEIAGSLRLSFDCRENGRKVNDYEESLKIRNGIESKEKESIERKTAFLGALRKLSLVLSEGFISFLKSFTLIRSSSFEFDSSALTRLSGMLETYEKCTEGKADFSDILDDSLSIKIGKKTAEAGSLHFTDIRGASANVRKNVFICGLSSAEFPGPVTQNYLALDDDITSFEKDSIYTSKGRIEENIRILNDFSRLAGRVSEYVSYSYSYYDTAELKERNPSSWLWRKAKGKNFSEAGFFQSGMTPSFDAGLEFISGMGRITADVTLDDTFDKSGKSSYNGGWSPSAIETYFSECKRRFYLERIAGIPNNAPDDPRVLIDAKDYGTLFHSVLESFSFRGREMVSKEELLREAGNVFDRFLKERPPVALADAADMKEDFLETIASSYDQNKNDESILVKEAHLSASFDDRLSVAGYPDRIASVQGFDDGYTVVDFKTGRSRKYTYKEDGNAEKAYGECLQVLLYAWLYNTINEGDDKTVSFCEYRYPRRPEDRNVMPYGKQAKEYIEGKLKDFSDKILQERLSSGDFPRTDKEYEKCRYCFLQLYCLWPGDRKEPVKEENGK